jgi:hypothetical protein
MAKKLRKPPPTAPTADATVAAPEIFAAELEDGGGVRRTGDAITEEEAQRLRREGRNVVVCGPELAANRALAKSIEQGANGRYKLCPPHANAGLHALPHCQPEQRPPEGHTFYETPNRKAL